MTVRDTTLIPKLNKEWLLRFGMSELIILNTRIQISDAWNHVRAKVNQVSN